MKNSTLKVSDKEKNVKVVCGSEKIFEEFYSSHLQNTITNLYGDVKVGEKIAGELIK